MVFRRPALLTAALAWLLSACAQLIPGGPPTPDTSEEALTLQSVSFAALPGWGADEHAKALATFLKSCTRINRRPATAPLASKLSKTRQAFGTAGDWQPVCKAAAALGAQVSPVNARRFFENWFRAYAVSNRGQTEGLFTGYFEPLLRGSRQKSGRFKYPLYKKPGDLITVDLGKFKKDLAGQQIIGRLAKNRLEPYADRAEIDRGALGNKGLELLWVDDPVDSFFLHIQGSGQVMLPGGRSMRVGYAGKNGHAYYAIGRELVNIGALTKENVSLQTIRAWLAANPGQADALMQKNRSYVFFRELKGDGPIGAQGVGLTPGRSLAVDRRYIPLGAPIWLDTRNPLGPHQPIRRLVIAQDTGGAIKGVVRGDLFWGAGPRAREGAGKMKEPGRVFILLPVGIAPVISDGRRDSHTLL
jgi:membrane-bound lytic murein transglycosylase A